MARVMFDKADLQQRLSVLERAIDGLGSAEPQNDISRSHQRSCYSCGILVESTCCTCFVRATSARARTVQKKLIGEAEITFPYKQKSESD